ncbi:MAG: Rieske 2Fe-2S domain-containing protein [Verrucomicrobiales bacterium]|nr:Rieske 2Fe-2S domain-containing protein [Verrucomicrobiales bacterium]
MAPGHGRVVRGAEGPVAVFRDDKGALHLHTAVCPHLGCIVAWNRVERTWDCPCHGSRFSATGELIGGPAETGLKPAFPDPE